jgi:putative transposase
MSNARLYHLNHCTYSCQYHLVWTPRYRGKVMADIYIKAEFKRIFKMICRWKGFQIVAWHIGDEHIHLYVSIPPKFSVSYAVSVIKGKSSAWIKKKTGKFPAGSFWNRGYYVSTLGANEVAVKRYIENQHHHQVEIQKLPLGAISPHDRNHQR